MCGRYTLTLDLDSLIQGFRIQQVEAGHRPRFNIAPGQDAPVIVPRGNERALTSMRWGLVPSWADPQDWKPLINARAETVAAKPAFRSAFRRRRCLVPADGFFEWEKKSGKKVPWRVLGPGETPFAMPGLWEQAFDGHGEELVTFTLITTEAGAGVERIHSRMPVMLTSPDAQDVWLWGHELSGLRRMLVAPRQTLTLYRVSARVNSPREEDAALIEAASEE